LGAMLVSVLMVKECPGAGNSQLPLLPDLYRSFKIDVRANPGFVPFLVSRLLVLTAFATLMRFALYFLKDVIGIANPAAVTADLLIVIGVCLLAAVYPAGRLSDRVGRRLLVVSSALLSALGIALLFFSSSYIHVILCGGLLGIAGGAFISTNWAMATDLVVKGEEARYLGLANLATAGGSALAMLAIGPAIDFFNAYGPNLGYSVMLLACFVCFLTGSLVIMRIKAWR